jgi:hypothetical protein
MTDFTHASYRALLRHIQGCGHVIGAFRDVPAGGKYVILRHDVDYSPIKAVELAEIEHELGARATVFLMLSSTYYNLLSPADLRAARHIVQLGHEIGFHYDTDVFPGPTADAAGRIAAQARFLSDVLETPVTMVAQHNPSVIATRVTVPGYTDAYADRFCKDIAYLSDSRRLWGTDDVFRFFEEHDRAQLLIHPLWWSADNKTRWEAFRGIRDAALARIEEELSAMNRSMERDERERRASLDSARDKTAARSDHV